MKIIVTANRVPFMPGGADYHIDGLVSQLRHYGHEVELLRFPFRFSPESEVQRMMRFSEATELNMPNGVPVDKVISLQFPAYGVQHDDHRVWIMHQHRAVYDLYGDQPESAQLDQLKTAVTEFDSRVLGQAKALFANSQRVAARLLEFNGLAAEPLYHPPYDAEKFFTDDPYDYIFAPSRLETLKRQDLLIRAAGHLHTPVKILLGGSGGQEQHYRRLIAELGVESRVQLIGGFSETEKRVLYARSLGVAFVPRDEDYGYVTLEAMLAAKPVITCTDSGGPLEFVQHEESGWVLPPQPEQLAAVIDRLYEDKPAAQRMGEAGRAIYDTAAISWHNVVEKLLAPCR
jgi:glycosyltransferase involved in cell wall biosynthesis